MRGGLLCLLAACSPFSTTGGSPEVLDAATCGCESTILTTVDGSPVAFGIDDANVYWRSPWQSFLSPPINAVSKDGGAPTATPGVGCQVAGAIIADANHVFAPCESNLTGLGAFPKSGSATTDLAPGIVVSQVWVDADDDVFWAGNGGIWKKPPAQASVRIVAGDVVTFAVDAADVYWWGLDRQIHSTTVTTIVSAEVPLGGLVADGSTLFWIDSNAGTITAAPHGGAPVVLLSGISQPNAIAVDASFVYAVGVFESFSALVRVPKAGGSPTVMFVGASLSELAVDDVALYTTDTRVGSSSMTMSIVRVTKP